MFFRNTVLSLSFSSIPDTLSIGLRKIEKFWVFRDRAAAQHLRGLVREPFVSNHLHCITRIAQEQTGGTDQLSPWEG
jgi:hypothetical protein